MSNLHLIFAEVIRPKRKEIIVLSCERMYEYVWAQNQLAGDHAAKVQKTCTDYQQEMEEIAANARNKARLLAENYSGQLNAAAMGDDPMERAETALSEYQRKYTRLNEEYCSAWQERYQRLVETLQSLFGSASRKSMDAYIGMITEARDAFAECAPKAPEKPDKGGSRTTKGG